MVTQLLTHAGRDLAIEHMTHVDFFVTDDRTGPGWIVTAYIHRGRRFLFLSYMHNERVFHYDLNLSPDGKHGSLESGAALPDLALNCLRQAGYNLEN